MSLRWDFGAGTPKIPLPWRGGRLACRGGCGREPCFISGDEEILPIITAGREQKATQRSTTPPLGAPLHRRGILGPAHAETRP